MVETITRNGTWDDVFAEASDEMKAIGDDIRNLVIGLHPQTTEVPRKGDKAVAYGFGKKKMSESYCYISPKTRWINLGFSWGTSLEDPNDLLEGTGRKLRHVKLRDRQTALSAGIAALVHSAMEERRLELGED